MNGSSITLIPYPTSLNFYLFDTYTGILLNNLVLFISKFVACIWHHKTVTYAPGIPTTKIILFLTDCMILMMITCWMV